MSDTRLPLLSDLTGEKSRKNILVLCFDWPSSGTARQKSRVRDSMRLLDYIATLLDTSTMQLSFSYDERGKPTLRRNDAEIPVSFAYSNAATAVLLSTEGRVGVDIEHARSNLPLLEIAWNFFNPAEYKKLLDITIPDDRQVVFLRLWTCKEALLKLTAQGMTQGLAKPDLSHCLDEMRVKGKDRSALRLQAGSYALWSFWSDTMAMAVAYERTESAL